MVMIPNWKSVGCEFDHGNFGFWKENPNVISLILNSKYEKPKCPCCLFLENLKERFMFCDLLQTISSSRMCNGPSLCGVGASAIHPSLLLTAWVISIWKSKKGLYFCHNCCSISCQQKNDIYLLTVWNNVHRTNSLNPCLISLNWINFSNPWLSSIMIKNLLGGVQIGQAGYICTNSWNWSRWVFHNHREVHLDLYSTLHTFYLHLYRVRIKET